MKILGIDIILIFTHLFMLLLGLILGLITGLNIKLRIVLRVLRGSNQKGVVEFSKK